MPWEFAKFNLLSGHSAMYGEHSWHWNFTQVSPWIVVFQGGFMGRHTSPGTSACCRVVKSGSAILQMPQGGQGHLLRSVLQEARWEHHFEIAQLTAAFNRGSSHAGCVPAAQGLPTIAATLLPLWLYGAYLTPG